VPRSGVGLNELLGDRARHLDVELLSTYPDVQEVLCCATSTGCRMRLVMAALIGKRHDQDGVTTARAAECQVVSMRICEDFVAI